MIMEIREYHLKTIVQTMCNDGHPKTSAPVKQIAQQPSEQQSGQKSVKLKMNKAEKKSSNPYCYVWIFKPFSHHLLNTTSEKQFFTDSRNQCHYKYIDDQIDG